MTANNPSVTLCLWNAVPTIAATESVATCLNTGTSGSGEEWQEFIEKLQDGERDPSQLADDGMDAPTHATIARAIALAQAYRDAGLPRPTSIVTDPNRGIVFERRDKEVFEVIHLWHDGSAEYRRFHNARLVERSKFP
jgi:hypothetical protein